jgi:predicted DNA-binding transcriptional regulator AlpA
MTADQLLTMNAVADRLAISLRTAQRRISAGEIPWVNVAPPGARRASIRVAESAVAEYVARRTRKPGRAA